MARASAKTEASFRKASAKIKRAARGIGGAWLNAVWNIGQEIMTDVKSSRPGRGVPVDEGTLRSTGRVEFTAVKGEKPSVELSFGGAAAPYALAQHEITTYRHKVGEPRYLVRGLERWSPLTSAALRAMRERAKVIFGKP